ncbi:MAG TPA: hypothetical protein VGH20_07090 [Myxococcales bacterium]|jgi:hypothetical protein
MRRLHEEPQEIRVPSEALARWALETTIAAQEATCAALAFLVHTEYATATLLPVPQLIRSSKAEQDQDGFLRMPRGAMEHFRLRSQRALQWMDLVIFFRERFPAAAARPLPDAIFSMAQLFARHDDELHAALDLVVRECVMPEIEDLLVRTVRYPPLQILFQRLRENDAQRSVDARRLAATVIEDPSGAKLWKIRSRLVATSTRALLASKPLLDELERGGFKVDRTRAARGFAKRLEEAVGELPGAPLLETLLHQLAGDAEGRPVVQPRPESFQTSSYND